MLIKRYNIKSACCRMCRLLLAFFLHLYSASPPHPHPPHHHPACIVFTCCTSTPHVLLIKDTSLLNSWWFGFFLALFLLFWNARSQNSDTEFSKKMLTIKSFRMYKWWISMHSIRLQVKIPSGEKRPVKHHRIIVFQNWINWNLIDVHFSGLY